MIRQFFENFENNSNVRILASKMSKHWTISSLLVFFSWFIVIFIPSLFQTSTHNFGIVYILFVFAYVIIVIPLALLISMQLIHMMSFFYASNKIKEISEMIDKNNVSNEKILKMLKYSGRIINPVSGGKVKSKYIDIASELLERQLPDLFLFSNKDSIKKLNPLFKEMSEAFANIDYESIKDISIKIFTKSEKCLKDYKSMEEFISKRRINIMNYLNVILVIVSIIVSIIFSILSFYYRI